MAKRAIDLSKIYVLPDLTVEILKRATPAERIAVSVELQRNFRRRLAAAIVSENPKWTEEQIKAEVARRFLAGEIDADQ
ncbi:MAG: hypothetical protein JWN40_297 [Phycisphaerales bacterium]|nr:hypothetical protein [Phycisphaerales bacterium]